MLNLILVMLGFLSALFAFATVSKVEKFIAYGLALTLVTAGVLI